MNSEPKTSCILWLHSNPTCEIALFFCRHIVFKINKNISSHILANAFFLFFNCLIFQWYLLILETATQSLFNILIVNFQLQLFFDRSVLGCFRFRTLVEKDRINQLIEIAFCIEAPSSWTIRLGRSSTFLWIFLVSLVFRWRAFRGSRFTRWWALLSRSLFLSRYLRFRVFICCRIIGTRNFRCINVNYLVVLTRCKWYDWVVYELWINNVWSVDYKTLGVVAFVAHKHTSADKAGDWNKDGCAKTDDHV